MPRFDLNLDCLLGYLFLKAQCKIQHFVQRVGGDGVK